MSLNLFLILLLIFQLLLIISTLKRKKLSISFGSLWIVMVILMIILVIFPNIIYKISDFFGFETSSNMLFLLGFFFLFYISFILTTTISMQNDRIKQLIQEISLLKESVENDRKKD